MRGAQAAAGGPSQRTPLRRANMPAAVCPNSGLTARRNRTARIIAVGRCTLGSKRTGSRKGYVRAALGCTRRSLMPQICQDTDKFEVSVASESRTYGDQFVRV